MKKRYIQILIILSLVGIIVSSILLNQHYRHLREGFDQKSFCSISKYVDCDAIDASPYSTLFSIPTSGFGLIYYILILLYSLAAVSNSRRKKAGLVFCWTPAKIAVVATFVMIYISFFKVVVFCLLCVAMYIINFLILIFLPLAAGYNLSQLPSVSFQYLKAILGIHSSLGFKPRFTRHAIFSLFVLALGCLILFQAEKHVEAQGQRLTNGSETNNLDLPNLTLEDIVAFHMSQDAVNISLENQPHKGPADARITIVEFSDFECPFCSRAAEYFGAVSKKYDKDVALYYVHYPLDKSCNPHMSRELHENACIASAATICAQQKGKFWELHDILFEKQKKLTQQNILTYATQIGLDSNWLKQCMESQETQNQLSADIELAQKLGVTGTPSIYLNGRPVRAWTQKDFLEAVIEKEIQQSIKTN